MHSPDASRFKAKLLNDINSVDIFTNAGSENNKEYIGEVTLVFALNVGPDLRPSDYQLVFQHSKNQNSRQKKGKPAHIGRKERCASVIWWHSCKNIDNSISRETNCMNQFIVS